MIGLVCLGKKQIHFTITHAQISSTATVHLITAWVVHSLGIFHYHSDHFEP